MEEQLVIKWLKLVLSLLAKCYKCMHVYEFVSESGVVCRAHLFEQL